MKSKSKLKVIKRECKIKILKKEDFKEIEIKSAAPFKINLKTMNFQ